MNRWGLVEGEKLSAECVHQRQDGRGKDTKTVRKGRVSEGNWVSEGK